MTARTFKFAVDGISMMLPATQLGAVPWHNTALNVSFSFWCPQSTRTCSCRACFSRIALELSLPVVSIVEWRHFRQKLTKLPVLEIPRFAYFRLAAALGSTCSRFDEVLLDFDAFSAAFWALKAASFAIRSSAAVDDATALREGTVAFETAIPDVSAGRARALCFESTTLSFSLFDGAIERLRAPFLIGCLESSGWATANHGSMNGALDESLKLARSK